MEYFFYPNIFTFLLGYSVTEAGALLSKIFVVRVSMDLQEKKEALRVFLQGWCQNFSESFFDFFCGQHIFFAFTKLFSAFRKNIQVHDFVYVLAEEDKD